MTKNSPVSRTRRNNRRRDGYCPLGSIQEGVNNMRVSGTDGFFAGTADKRSSQPFGNNNRRDCVNNNPPQPQRTFTEGRSDDTTSTRTNTSDASSPEEKATDTFDGPICIVTNGFDISEDDAEVSRASCFTTPAAKRSFLSRCFPRCILDYKHMFT
jgi:hypothetical protein